MNIEQIAPEALKLPVRERAFLAAFLWESIRDPYDSVAEDDEEDALALALQRDEEMERGVVSAISHSDLMSRLRS